VYIVKAKRDPWKKRGGEGGGNLVWRICNVEATPLNCLGVPCWPNPLPSPPPFPHPSPYISIAPKQIKQKNRLTENGIMYGVATISRLLQIIGLFCRIWTLLSGSFAKETYNFKEPTNRSPLICILARRKYPSNVKELCIHEWDMNEIWMRQVTLVNESCHSCEQDT